MLVCWEGPAKLLKWFQNITKHGKTGTPPKINIDTQNDDFSATCFSFEIWRHLRYPCEFSGV